MASGTEGAHVPIGRDAGNILHEIAQQCSAARGVNHFGMEHHAVEFAFLVGDHGEGGVFALGDNVETERQFDHTVAVAHPHFILRAERPDVFEQWALARDFERGAAEFALVVRAFNPATQLRHHRLLAVADAEHGHAHLKNLLGRARVSLSVTEAGPPDRMIGIAAAAPSAPLWPWL